MLRPIILKQDTSFKALGADMLRARLSKAQSDAAFDKLRPALLVFVNVVPNTWQIKLEPRLRHGVAIGFAAGFAVLLIAQPSPFIYFQF